MMTGSSIKCPPPGCDAVAVPGVPEFAPADLAAWTSGRWEGQPPPALRGVAHDTRLPLPGALYVAIRGQRFDGHRFLDDARAAGAGAAMVEADAPPPVAGWPLLRVADTREALQAAAAAYRRRVGAIIVGVTGSVGKTTVKELLSAMLSGQGEAWATQGNWNNDIGLPLSLLAMPLTTERAVFEIGTGAPGEIRALCRVLCPDAAIVTEIGPAHLEHFGSLDAIADEKADLPRAVPSGGFVVLNRDDPYFGLLASAAGCERVTISMQREADFRGHVIDPVAARFRVFAADVPEGIECRGGLPGRHQMVNALLAIAAARRLGCDWETIRLAVRSVTGGAMRWQVLHHEGVMVVNDAYNANPVSMRAALETFARIENVDRKLLVLGDMLEMGLHTASAHRELGACLACKDWHAIVLVGAQAERVREGAVRSGFDPERLFCVPDAVSAAAALRGELRAGDALLLKASRGIALEGVLAAMWPEMGGGGHGR